MILDKPMKTIIAKKYPEGEALQIYRQLESGEVNAWLKSLLSEAAEVGVNVVLIRDEPLRSALAEEGYDVESLSDNEFERVQNRRLQLLVEVGWVKDEEEAKQLIRDFALEISKAKLKELAAKPDLQVMHSVQALDEVDKVVNILETRVKEWYGLHFPELERILDNPEAYVKFVTKFGRRENITKKEAEKLSIPPEKIEELLSAAESSKGSEVRDEDLQRISALSESAIQLSSVRDGLAKHVERTMARIAPNVTSVAGATIGARLIAKAGGLEKMARLPASTIQVLGAEKALFRALRTGARPPKHGILFQHQVVHSAPKWQRGKIARSLAAKLAIAARIDFYRGSKEEGLKDSLEKRFEEIRQKYSEPPKSVKPEFKNRGKKYGKKKQRRAETQTGKARRQR